jgi:hypothetical protein
MFDSLRSHILCPSFSFPSRIQHLLALVAKVALAPQIGLRWLSAVHGHAP